jgi:hypothetical protein
MEQGSAAAAPSGDERQRLLEQQHQQQQQAQVPQGMQGMPPSLQAQPMSTHGGGVGGTSDLLERKKALERQLRELEAQMAGGDSSHND